MPKNESSLHKSLQYRGRGKAISRTSTSSTPPWRKSNIPRSRTISRTMALQQYKLEPSDLDGLPFTESPVAIGSDVNLKVSLYSERMVERVAWVKHGGPVAFQSYLDSLRNDYLHVHPLGVWEFHHPRTYSQTAATIPRLRGKSPLPVLTITPHILQAPFLTLQREFQSINCAWLWAAATRVLSFPTDIATFSGSLTPAEKATALRALLDIARTYPPRPASPPPVPDSTEHTLLRTVLARAPSLADRTRGKLVLHEFFGGRRIWLWDAEYMDQVFSALVALITRHGCGDEGWMRARWEVYDSFSKNLQGLSYRNRLWYDGASDWLRGRMESPGEHAVTTRQDNTSDLGRRYNSMLPNQSYQV
ncbi:hypothetical protein B0H15DRAFT_783273 [Mycena belliarum]|uniref:Uncharacterized protein n=1 Tax=Mycena belliarum TaxID=1033014 RepID=A0AAD6XT09_9AGAR|nr:hypothetical protein B0H15DRAFT_783273 [Mycena belliae]